MHAGEELIIAGLVTGGTVTGAVLARLRIAARFERHLRGLVGRLPTRRSPLPAGDLSSDGSGSDTNR